MSRCGVAALVTALWIPFPAGAVIVAGGDGTGNASAPSPDPGFSRLAIVAGLSGVYLGKGWILTAGHVLTAARNQKRFDVSLDGASYRLLPETAVPLSRGSEPADLVLVRIADGPERPVPEIAARTPARGAQLFLAGNGPRREAAASCWNAAGQPVAKPGPGARCGFAWVQKRKEDDPPMNAAHWGRNVVAEGTAIFPGPKGTRTPVFGTVFRPPAVGAGPDEAQAGVGDSGGPVFVKDGDGWRLAGVMLGASSQLPRASVYGDQTFIADLSQYRESLLAVLAKD